MITKPIKIEKLSSSTFQLTRISLSLVERIATDDRFSFLPPGYQYQPKFRLLGYKGVKIKMVRADGTFPAGLFSAVVDFITEELEQEVEMSTEIMEHFLPLDDLIENGINDDVFSDFEIDGNPVILRDYQLEAVKSAFENRNCLLNLSTGAGKCLGPKTKLKIRLPKEIADKYELEAR